MQQQGAAAAVGAAGQVVLRPRLHTLQLHESAVLGGNDYSRFGQRWMLLLGGGGDGGDDAHSTISAGDAVYFPELLTGAGEFEGLRFVVAPADDDGGGGSQRTCWELLEAGVEMPAFPDAVSELAGGAGAQLRGLYHEVFEQMLLAQGLSMAQICEGCDGGPDGLWDDVAGGHCRLRPKHKQGRWDIPLARCQRKGEWLPPTR